MSRYALLVRSLALLVTVAACGPAEGVEVEPLPSLEQSSPEARAGLPELVGAWRFAGWELAPDDSVGLRREDLPRFGVISLEAQRRDSVGGQYLITALRAPLYGEVRRDGVLALVGVFGPGDLRFMSGRVTGDTVWVELSSLTDPGGWPTDARAAFVRTPAQAPPSPMFVRLRGARPPPPPPVAAAPLPRDTMGVPSSAPSGIPGAASTTPTTPRPQPETPRPAPQPRRDPPRQPAPEPTPPVEEEPPVPLLGEPTAGEPLPPR